MSALVDLTAVKVVRDGRTILDNAAFLARAGEFIGVIGPNGAGKTTLLRVLAGLEPKVEGDCRIDGEPIAMQAPLVRARRISYLPQLRPIYWSMTVESIVALGRFAYGSAATLEGENAAAVARAIEAAGIGHLRQRAATMLSGGEAARVHVARALAAETPILLADEPTAALDPRHQLAIMDVLRQRADSGALVIAALHDLALAARYCTRIMLFEDGRLTADGEPSAVLTAENLSRAFGVSVEITASGNGFSIAFAP